jgi:hypothetical protein
MSKTKVFLFTSFLETLEEDLKKQILKLEEQDNTIKCISQVMDNNIFKVYTTIVYE